MSVPRVPRPLADVVVAWSLAAAIGGGLVGGVDVLLSWGALVQFGPSLLTRTGTLLYVAALYSLVFAVAGALLGCAGSLLLRFTDLRALSRGLAARRREALSRGPEHAIGPVAHAMAAALALPIALAVGFRVVSPWLATRNHMGLIVAVAMAAAVAAVLVGVILSLVIARALRPLLAALATRPLAGRALSRPGAWFYAAALVLLALAAVALSATWSVAQHLPVRRFAVVVAIVIAAFACRDLGARLSRALAGKRFATGAASVAIAVLLIAAIMLWTGSIPAVQKGASAYTGLAGPLANGIRKLIDLDRDGFSPVLSGGDCDDFDASVNVRASDRPGDGIDQNCIGGDPQLSKPRAPSFAELPESVPRPLSVVLVTIDTLRADHLGAYGYSRNTSPRIDQVAASGTIFENAWAHAPSTRYSMPAILTGRYPLSAFYDTTVRGWPGLQKRGDNLAVLLKAGGRFTGAVLNYWYFDRERSMDRGFDDYDNRNRSLHRSIRGEGPAKTKGSSSKEQTDKAIEFVRKHQQEPFFLWVHYYDPHYEYEKHPDIENFGDGPIDLYDNEIRYTDLHIGRLIDELARSGLDESTAIVITGDHGEGFGEHGVDLHGYHLYAAQTKVPLIIKVPGLAASRPTTPVGHIDILPTIANLVGASPTPTMQGRSLLPAMLGGPAADQDGWVFQQLSFENDNEMRAAASKQCHVVFNVSPQTSWELYRIDEDPLEERDIIGTSGPCADAQDRLARWYDHSEIPDGAATALVEQRPTDALGLQIGEAARLLQVEAPTRARAGELIQLTYTVEARRAIPDHWKVFVHFRGPRGAFFTDDHSPPWRPSWWKPGQVIRYTRHVRIPPSSRQGAYQVWTGMFRGDRRLPLTPGSKQVPIQGDAARVATIQVER
ncbi:MAG: sulfatase-like hydrolase/transferase [Deltaproteobacteria bacterium]|nr:sulfatase-like hydrolase/transferase [Deltaproteobacteria bacterium]